jgi:3alpha(or 20beta)-hydroxysteroid dehydrogenase
VLELNGKVALITGASRGQGAAEARLLAARGARVVIADILEDEGRRVAAKIGAAGMFVRLDCSSESSWNHAITETVRSFGRLDVLVNNAAIGLRGGVESSSLDDYLRTVMVNQVGVFLGMKASVAALKVHGGSIINIASIASFRGSPNSVAYNATKWAVRGMTKSAARELAPYGIRVNAVHPSVVETDQVAELLKTSWRQENLDATPAGRFATVDDIAKMVLFLASDESAFCMGADFVVDGGRSA